MALPAMTLQDDDSPGPKCGAWSMHAPHVRKAIKFIKAKGTVTAEQMVGWDALHGKHLFNWNDDEAATQWRYQQARVFLGKFRTVIDGLRVRSFINIPKNLEAGVDERTYFTVDAISRNEKLRAIVIADITKRMASQASELKMWKLSHKERSAIIATLEQAMT